MLQFTKLRIAGFKSFVDPAELLIEPGLTGIVGPNGCGKSNLIEALRWVMGETSAKQMRGGEMDDVIFAGSAERPGRNIAEVVLEMDNGARTAPPPYAENDELLVSRRIERAKGSVYRVNGREMRARDVHLLFADAASGARSAAMVTQGQVAQLIEAKPSDRRTLLEEAAGVVGLHARRHEAELRLQSAETNLRRLDDVLSTLEVQRQQLQKQARQAGRYRQIAARIRELEAMILRQRWRSAEDEVAAAGGRCTWAERAVANATGAAADAASRQAGSAARLPDLRTREAEAAAGLQRLMRDRDLLDAEERQMARDGEAARAQARQIDEDLRRERTLAADAGATLDRLSTDGARLAELRSGEAAAMAAAQASLAAAAAAAAELDGRVLSLAETVAADRARRTALLRSRDDAAAQVRRLSGRRGETERQRQAAIDEQRRLPDAGAAANAAGDAEQAAAFAHEAAEQADAERARRAAEEASAAAGLQAAETALARATAEERALAEILGAGPNAQAAGVLDDVAVAPGLEVALAAALGDDLLAAEDPQAAAHWRRLPAYDDAAALPDDAAPLALEGGTPPALARRLGQIGLIDDAEAGERLQPALRPGQRLVSRAGGLWRWDGYTRTAGAATPAAIRLRQKARLDEVRQQLTQLQAGRTAAAERHAAIAGAARAAAATEQQARAQLRVAEAALVRARQVLGDAVAGRARVEQRLAGLTDALATLSLELDDAATRSATLEDELAALADGHAEQAQLEALRADLARRRATHMERQARVDGLAREAAGRVRRLQAVEAEIVLWTGRRDGMHRQLETYVERRRQAQAELARLDALPAQLAERRRESLDALSAAEAGRRDAGDHLAAAETTLAEADRGLRIAEKALAEAREERVRADALLTQAEHGLRGVVEMIADRLGAAPQDLPQLAGEVPAGTVNMAVPAGTVNMAVPAGTVNMAVPAGTVDVADDERRLDRLRRDRELMGPVNLRAEEQQAELAAQIAELDQQRADLVEAVGKLRRGVTELDREGRERLLGAFVEIDRHFQALFQRLFGGGHAHLALTDNADPLVAGLEIMASPPGKKLQLMSLLSGGEQTLTALALRFALFLQRPAPVCVLDEVDAALDDANVDRFCALLSDFAGGGTRFLVITHHRLTMARMDRLFGVTMAERGASRLVSVDLGAAEALRQTA